MRDLKTVVCVMLIAMLATGGALAAPTADGILSPGEWADRYWFTDTSEGPGTGYDDDPLPVFDGYLDWNEDGLYMGFNVHDTTPNTNRDFLYVTFDITNTGVFDAPVDALFWGSVPGSSSFFGEAYPTTSAYPWDRSQRSSTWGTDGGVTAARTIGASNRVYELDIPWAALGVTDTTQDFSLGFKVQAREGDYPDRQNVNFYPDMPDGITPIRADTRVEVEGNFAEVWFPGGEYESSPLNADGTPATTPEPATWVLLLASSAIGGFLRRRRDD